MNIQLIIKEAKHILRDKRTVMILFGMPIVMMILFGFAISTDIKNVRTVVVAASIDTQTRAIVDRLDASEYFSVVDIVATPSDAEAAIRNQKADMAIVFSPNYANHRYDHTASIQFLMDASNPNMAIQQQAYAQQVIAGAIANMPNAGSQTSTSTSIRMLFNPRMLSSYNFVPGIMGVILMLICAMMTSVSIAREKERGTMEVLLVSPVKPLYILIAKATPYLALSLLILCCILLLATYVLGVPMSGSVLSIVGVSLLYILLSLSLGLLISVVADTQLVAMLVSAVLLMLPSLLLSSMIYPIESMPKVLQYLSCVIPARWFISAVRKLMIMGVGLHAVAHEVAILAIMTFFLLTLALKNFKVRL